MSKEKNDQSFGNWLREPQTMIGISAIILSICGLFISFYQTSLDRQYQRASVWPNVEVSPSLNSGEIAFHVQNSGIGPAIIKAINVKFEGNVQQNWEQLMLAATLIDTTIEESPPLNLYRSLINNDVLPPGSERQDIFRIRSIDKNNESKKVVDKFYSQIVNNKININLCYCSIYDECWITTMIDESNKKELAPGDQRPIESCKEVENSNI